MLTHEDRIAAARSAVDYITGRSLDEQRQPVPNCPGWTVYNAAVHIGRVGVAWEEMILASPDDPDSRVRGYARTADRPAGAPTSELAAWIGSALDQLATDTDRPCYFSMAGGEGTVGLWAWHAASELGLHRLDVEDALGHPHSMTDDQAIDATSYTCQFFLPAMRRATGRDPGSITARLLGAAGEVLAVVDVDSDNRRSVVVEGPPIQVLLAVWGRPYHDVVVAEGDPGVLAEWRQLPTEAFQFGTWD